MMNLAFCIPFAGLLLCIAVLPLVKAEWWEAHQPHAIVFWSLLFVLPFAFVYGPGQAFEKVLECIVDDYLTFIILLFGLFCVSGNITLEGDLAGSPRINVGLLLIGTMLSSWIGTTGAQHADGASHYQDECLEKTEKPYYGVLYFPDLQHRRLPDPDRGSASFNGIYARGSVFLEPASFSGSFI